MPARGPLKKLHTCHRSGRVTPPAHGCVTCSRPHSHVADDERLAALGLEKERRLLLPDADLVCEVVTDSSETRLVTARAVGTHAGHRRARGVAPQRDGRVADPRKLHDNETRQ